MLCYNILEEGTVTASADAGYPASRLYDRSLGFYWMYSSLNISVNQSTILPVDTLIVEGHNFSGGTLQWQYSDDGNNWVDAVTDWTQSGNGQIVKTIAAPASHQYWRLYSTGVSSPRAVEVFMGRMLSLPIIWSSNPTLTHEADVQRERTYGGVDHFIRVGPKRRVRTYTVFMDRSLFPIDSYTADIEYLDDFSKPLFFIDHEDACFLVWPTSIPSRSDMNEGLTTMQFTFTEVV
jgi:hypothetical protein